MNSSSSSNVWNIMDYGAKADNKTNIAPIVDRVIQEASESGGGVVLIPRGVYKSGTIHLKSNIILELSVGAVLNFSVEDDFDEGEELPYNPHADLETSIFHYTLIFGENVSNVTIQGRGRINGSPYKRVGPKGIALQSCKEITIRDIFLENIPNYNINFLNCDNICVDNVTIYNGLADGIDLDNCRFARISNCNIDAFDDAICLKTSPSLGYISYNSDIVVTNCTIRTSCYALKMGTESSGDCKNVTFSNCSCYPQPNRTCFLGGVALEAVDGAHVENIAVSNISITGALSPLFLRLGNRGRAQQVPTPGSVEQITISNITAQNAIIPCIIAGIPNFPVRHVTIDNVVFASISDHSDKFVVQQNEIKPGSEMPIELQIREEIGSYPEVKMFGILPSWGIFCRHAENIAMRNIILRCQTTDHRSAAVFDDVKGINVESIHAVYEYDEKRQMKYPLLPLIWLNNSKGTVIQNCDSNRTVPCFIRVSGSNSKHIAVQMDPFVYKSSILLDPNVDKHEVLF